MIDKIMAGLFKAADNMRVTPGKPVDKVQTKPFTLEQNPAAETTREAARVARPAGKTPLPVPATERQDQPVYVPLPWRTPLYQDAKFYWQVKDFSAKLDTRGEARVIFSVDTLNLGLLWFSMTAQPGSLLSVQCIAETQAAVEAWQAAAGLLQQELADLGFNRVIISGRRQAGIRSITDIDPHFGSAADSLLLDVKI
ncbi:hypothetical protein [Desulforamulus hydrothermalis]|uniref:Flagellar hook-length control protein-like C-terminal domain-containing protein n=1 Tax=Desulforamulus hydrothermalis Lam5 = DSM 18033 TaxID=1121428 RepID=K8EGS1_9FIRM|nr:hypothetical protein [Desulforamulus hydrothermalis]CCO07836.1 conserved hypothetical protein [Desulforamulus hydrothermalis Lam5 = DSM 18033]SHH27347.1 hypothetical protein SAMN02745177_02040 [Desulforamulus hydrothermalis Lam5 = DSM 18033]